MKNSRNYRLLKLGTDWKTGEKVWYSTDYTRQGLISRLAINDSIINNIGIEYLVYMKVGNGIKEIDISIFKDDIAKEIDYQIIKSEKVQKKYEYYKRLNRYTFRRGPVPLTAKYRPSNYYRAPQLQRTRRNEEIVEYKEFKKAKNRRVNLPVWDDRPRHLDKSWKTSYKVRKQWMKHLDKHKDTVYCSKREINI